MATPQQMSLTLLADRPAGRRRVKVKHRDWLAAAAMSAGIGLFLWLASPSGGRLHAPGALWMLAGPVTLGVVLAALAVAFGLSNHPEGSRSRRAAVLGAATGISWGFVAAVIKELSSPCDCGPVSCCTMRDMATSAAGPGRVISHRTGLGHKEHRRRLICTAQVLV